MTPGVQQVRERADTLLTRLKLLDRHDKAYRGRRNAWTLAAIGAGIAGILTTIAANATHVGPSGAAVFVVTVLLVLGCVVQAVRYHRLDLDDRKITLAIQLVTMLRADIAAKDPIAMIADLRSYRRGGTIVERAGSFLGDHVRKYRHAWLTLRARLADGNVLDVRVVDRVTRRQKRKSHGGKTKYKTRVRGRTDVRIAVRLAKRYRPAADIPGRVRGPGVPPLRLTALMASTDGARLDALFRSPIYVDVNALPGGRQVLDVLRWLYGGLNAAAKRTA